MWLSNGFKKINSKVSLMIRAFFKAGEKKKEKQLFLSIFVFTFLFFKQFKVKKAPRTY